MIVYRDAIPADADALDAMASRCWTETFAADVAPADVATYLAEAHGPDGQLRRDLVDPAMAFRLACDGDAIAGYARLSPLTKIAAPDPAPGAMELRQLYVLKDWQGAGVAAALIGWAHEAARAGGAPELYLSCFEHNPRALIFYARHGWEVVGEMIFRVGTQMDRDFVLRKRL